VTKTLTDRTWLAKLAAAVDPTLTALLQVIAAPVLAASGATWAARRIFKGAERQAAAVIHAAELAAQAARDDAELNQRSAQAVAEISRRTQLEIERDRAIHEYRSQRVRRVLDRADRRVAEYFALNRLIYPWEPDKRDEVQAALLELESNQLSIHVLGETAEIPAAVGFVQALHTLATVDGEWISAARAAFTDEKSSFNALVNPYITDYNEALRQAHLAAISYVFGETPGE
jgi:hypothetical protein